MVEQANSRTPPIANPAVEAQDAQATQKARPETTESETGDDAQKVTQGIISQSATANGAAAKGDLAASSDDDALAIASRELQQQVDSQSGQAGESPDSDLIDEPAPPQFEIADEQTIEFPATWTRLGKNEIWVDMKNKQVILAGYICINVGALEMFACPAGTKEHESVVAVNALPSEMHAALLAVGAETGAPCSWDDVSFTSASGSRIKIDVRWRDEKTKEIITRPAKEMMKLDGERKIDIDWIFGGSRFHEDLESKTRYYSANSGEMICVSNFSTAAIDVNIDSSDTNSSLLFWANTENIPPRGTRVYLMLTPGDFFNAQRQVFAEAEPQTNPNTVKNPDPATEDSGNTEASRQDLEPIKTPEKTKPKENSSDKG